MCQNSKILSNNVHKSCFPFQTLLPILWENSIDPGLKDRVMIISGRPLKSYFYSNLRISKKKHLRCQEPEELREPKVTIVRTAVQQGHPIEWEELSYFRELFPDSSMIPNLCRMMVVILPSMNMRSYHLLQSRESYDSIIFFLKVLWLYYLIKSEIHARSDDCLIIASDYWNSVIASRKHLGWWSRILWTRKGRHLRGEREIYPKSPRNLRPVMKRMEESEIGTTKWCWTINVHHSVR